MSTFEAIGLFVLSAGLFALVDWFFTFLCCAMLDLDDEQAWIPCLLIGAAVVGIIADIICVMIEFRRCNRMNYEKKAN